MRMLDELRQDLRYGVRTLRSSPAFTLTALFTMALGIGVNAAIFSAVRMVLLEPLPFAEPARIVRAYHANPANGVARGTVSEPDFLDWKRTSQTIETMAGFWFVDGMSGIDLTGTGN